MRGDTHRNIGAELSPGRFEVFALHMSDGEFGPNTKLVRAAVARLNAIAWLTPDAEMDALVPAAVEFVRERLDEHFAALTKASPSFVPPEAKLETHRSLLDASERLLRATETLDAPKLPPGLGFGPPLPRFNDEAKRWLDALGAAQRSSYHGEGVPLANAALERVPHVYYKLDDGHPLSVPWLRDVWSNGPSMNHPGYPAMGAHLRWLVRHGDARPSPWAPIIALFERGVLPMVSSDATLVVWVPLRIDGRLVPDATGAPAGVPTRNMSGSRDDDNVLRAFHEGGFAPVPVRLVYPPTPNLPAPPPPPRATINPVPPPPMGASSSSPEPWYRRLIRRK